VAIASIAQLGMVRWATM